MDRWQRVSSLDDGLAANRMTVWPLIVGPPAATSPSAISRVQRLPDLMTPKQKGLIYGSANAVRHGHYTSRHDQERAGQELPRGFEPRRAGKLPEAVQRPHRHRDGRLERRLPEVGDGDVPVHYRSCRSKGSGTNPGRQETTHQLRQAQAPRRWRSGREDVSSRRAASSSRGFLAT